MGGGVADEEEGVVLSWGQGGGGSANDPLVISSNDDLEGEDSEVITAFSGQCIHHTIIKDNNWWLLAMI